MTDPADDLRSILFRLELTVNTLASTVEALKTAVEKSVSKERVDALQKEVDSLNSFKDWAVKIVLGMVIVALVGLVVVQNGVTP